jgi:triosephosphate isomerase
MNGSFHFCDELIGKFSTVELNKNLKVILAAPFVFLNYLSNKLIETKLGLDLAGQDCHVKVHGPYTGDISSVMLKEVGCKYVILGHSERRQNYTETGQLVKNKAQIALENGLTPIICIGEKNYVSQKTEVSRQASASIPKNNDGIIIAYEPIYSVGTGIVPTEDQIASAVKIIKNSAENDIPVIYGGSVTEKNCVEIMNVQGISGLLVGNASLNTKQFINIYNNIKITL